MWVAKEENQDSNDNRHKGFTTLQELKSFYGIYMTERIPINEQNTHMVDMIGLDTVLPMGSGYLSKGPGC